MRKAIIVLVNISNLGGRKREEEATEALEELNHYLANGWKVDHSFPMSGTGSTMLSSTVVVLQKDE